MSATILASLCGLFGSEQFSDCTIVFCRAAGDSSYPPGAAGAHRLVVYAGSSYFRANAGWSVQAGGQPSAAGGAITGGSDNWGSSKPVLRVLLDRAEDRPHAEAAIRFMYTGQVDAASAADLLHTRRLAAYLQVEGCPEACEEALRLSATNSNGGALSVQLPEANDDDALKAFVDSLRSACRLQLLQHSGSGGTMGDVSVGDLLGWAFPDVPSVLSDPELKGQVLRLSAAALEAMLSSGQLYTDSEDNVLLLLAEWLQANPQTTPEDRERLCKQVRLCQLSDTYLVHVVQLLDWFPLSTTNWRHLVQYRMELEGPKRSRLAAAAEGVYDCSSPWHRGGPRPQSRWDRGKEYTWAIKREALVAAVTSGPRKGVLLSAFSYGKGAPLANGWEWRPFLKIQPEGDAAGVYLECIRPSALRINASDPLVTVASPGNVRLAVHRWSQDGAREEVFSRRYAHQQVQVEVGWGCNEALPLQQRTAGANPAEPSAAWAAYLRDGEVRGTLVWM
ncbi:hypothetical protein GPECTOR_2g1404 [Gonium pectorale]|uniref:BACK domain-containing protein n=1 Tax=Gonium pectorale TaxID=33097 RepID=A0A150H1G9_GONPE|nr:hypothetical protein GPECTOR_2g1404 [Gonium pectorale]|eukprot:KXZ55853.1 hypothetical protein GPECTOR_2g1404 [Gonium pectorale]